MTQKAPSSPASASAGNSPATAPKRGRPFAKGQSGNPNGRPKVVEEFRARARKAVDEHVLAAWVAEVEAQGPEWVRCSELLAAYGYGKPSSAPEDLQAVKAAGGGLTVLTRDELLAIARGTPPAE